MGVSFNRWICLALLLLCASTIAQKPDPGIELTSDKPIHFQLDKNQLVYFYSPEEEFVQCRSNVTYRVDFDSPLDFPNQMCIEMALDRPIQQNYFPKWKQCNDKAGDRTISIAVQDPYYQSNVTYGFISNSPNGSLVAFTIYRTSSMVDPGEWGGLSAIPVTPSESLSVLLGQAGFRYTQWAKYPGGTHSQVDMFTSGVPVGKWKTVWQGPVQFWDQYTDIIISTSPFHQIFPGYFETFNFCDKDPGRQSCNVWLTYNDTLQKVVFSQVVNDSNARISVGPWFASDGTLVRCYYTSDPFFSPPFCSNYKGDQTCCVHADNNGAILSVFAVPYRAVFESYNSNSMNSQGTVLALRYGISEEGPMLFYHRDETGLQLLFNLTHRVYWWDSDGDQFILQLIDGVYSYDANQRTLVRLPMFDECLSVNSESIVYLTTSEAFCFFSVSPMYSTYQSRIFYNNGDGTWRKVNGLSYIVPEGGFSPGFVTMSKSYKTDVIGVTSSDYHYVNYGPCFK